jgi:hypothetical protein
MAEVRVRVRSSLDTGAAADGMNATPMDMAMEMATAVTANAAETASEEALELMERNQDGKQCRRSEVKGDLLGPRALEEAHGAGSSAASPRTRTATPNHPKDGTHA